MIDFLRGIGPICQAFVATLGTYLLTAAGTVPVLFFRTAPRRLMDAMRGLSGRELVASSRWSLLFSSSGDESYRRLCDGRFPTILVSTRMPSEQALLARIRGEYREMPDLRLTAEQACRDERTLYRRADGAFCAFPTMRAQS